MVKNPKLKCLACDREYEREQLKDAATRGPSFVCVDCPWRGERLPPLYEIADGGHARLRTVCPCCAASAAPAETSRAGFNRASGQWLHEGSDGRSIIWDRRLGRWWHLECLREVGELHAKSADIDGRNWPKREEQPQKVKPARLTQRNLW